MCIRREVCMRYVVLAVDQATVSGWSTWLVDGEDQRLLYAGVATTAADREYAVQLALGRAENEATLLIPAFEQHRKHKGFSNATALSLHRSLGRWLESLDLNAKREVRYAVVPIAAWRAHCGLHPGQGKSEAVRLALTYGEVADHNEAEAILLGAYACLSQEVKALLPKRRRSKALTR